MSYILIGVMIKLMKYLGFLAVCIMLSTTLQAQTKKAYLKAADEAYATKDFHSALDYYGEALEFDSSDLEVMFKTAEAARQFNAYDKAEQLYETIVNQQTEDQFPLILFWLAQVEQKLGKYDEAIAHYQLFNAENGDQGYYNLRSNKEIQACEWANSVTNTEREDVAIEKLGEDVNTPYSEFGAADNDGTLMYSSLRFERVVDKKKPPILFSKVLSKKSGEMAMEEDESINDPLKHTAHTAFNSSKSRMYYTICDYINASDIQCKIYYRELLEGAWGEPVLLPAGINLDSVTNTQPNIGVDKVSGKEQLYFVSDRDGGKGGLDIWVSTINEDGTFETPQNLSINTPEDDITPFYHRPTNTLYFSSQGYQGLGGLDVYKSNQYTKGWGQVNHLGNVINTSYHDIYYSMSDDGKEGYISSNREGSFYLEEAQKACCYDIYDLSFIPTQINLVASTFDALDRTALIGSKLTLYNLTDTEADPLVLENFTSNEFVFALESDIEYKVVAEKEGYNPDSTFFNTMNIYKNQDIKKSLFLKSKTLHVDLLTFDQTNMQPLHGTTVTLIDLTDTSQAAIVEINEDGNDYVFPLERGKKYMFIVSKKGFQPESFEMDTDEFDNVNRVEKKVYLGIGDLESFLPLILFFDNDIPEPKSWLRKTESSYSDLYPAYFEMKDEFISNYLEGNPDKSQSDVNAEYERFFENQVRKGAEDMQKFLGILLAHLKRGENIEISLKGYTSPRSSREYNYILGQRRVNNVLNEFSRFEEGALLEFIDSGQLKIQQRSFGETTSPRNISDSINDPANSVYSLPASKERRVEIVQIKREN